MTGVVGGEGIGSGMKTGEARCSSSRETSRNAQWRWSAGVRSGSRSPGKAPWPGSLLLQGARERGHGRDGETISEGAEATARRGGLGASRAAPQLSCEMRGESFNRSTTVRWNIRYSPQPPPSRSYQSIQWPPYVLPLLASFPPFCQLRALLSSPNNQPHCHPSEEEYLYYNTSEHLFSPPP